MDYSLESLIFFNMYDVPLQRVTYEQLIFLNIDL